MMEKPEIKIDKRRYRTKEEYHKAYNKEYAINKYISQF